MTPSSATIAAGLVLLWLCLVLWPGSRTVAGTRLRCLSLSGAGRRTGAAGVGADPAGMRQSTNPGAGRSRAAVFAAIAGSAILATVPSLLGGVAAVAGTAGTYLILHGTSRNERTVSGSGRWVNVIRRLGRAGDAGAGTDPALPFAIDLLAVCLRAGMAIPAALRSVANTLSAGAPHESQAPVEVSGVLARVAAASELGSEAATAWADWIGHPRYGPLARALVVTGESGSAVAGRLDVVSRQLRTTAGQQALARAQRVGVTLMAPLGLCFLPAFVCLGVVPVVIGIAGQVFG